MEKYLNLNDDSTPMCYSKEVSLTVAIIIFIFCATYYYRYVIRPKKSAKQSELSPVFTNVLLAFLFTGFHQFSEFLSILTGNEIVYKIGLFLSLWIMYFLMMALEKLTNHSFKTKYLIPIIILVSIHMFYVPMSFENMRFWVRGHSHFVWAAAWIGFFFYWNVCIFYMLIRWRKIKDRLLDWPYIILINFSFMVTVMYVVMTLVSGPFGFKVFQDFPSIWCTLLVVQMPLLPFVFNFISKQYRKRGKEPIKHLKIQTQILLILIALFLLALYIIIFIPFSDTPAVLLYR